MPGGTMPVITTPHAAVQAREVLVDARYAAVRTGSVRCASTRSVVDLHDAGDGLPRLVLDAASSAVPGLAACRVAAVTVVDARSRRRVRIVASYRMGRPDETGRRHYDPTILSVRLDGPEGTVTVPVDEFLRVETHPDRVRRREVVAHLQREHEAEVLAAVRELGHDVEIVQVAAEGDDAIVVHLLGPHGAGRLAITDSAASGALRTSAICGCDRRG
ncbi:hypothetical protein [Nocardioides sp.]|uniref:hypothetical protein n=1 Tax=Nocardioides sp. TaxID=35761 RepID=UPI00321A2C91